MRLREQEGRGGRRMRGSVKYKEEKKKEEEMIQGQGVGWQEEGRGGRRRKTRLKGRIKRPSIFSRPWENTPSILPNP